MRRPWYTVTMVVISDEWRSGKVLHGDQTGRTLGFPTANFEPRLANDITQEGVYASNVIVDGNPNRGALYIGPRITLGETRRVLEIHLLDFNGDLYDKELQFQVGRFIRPPMDFDSVDALKAQLARDIMSVRSTTV